jgi:hypothetical protein
VAEGKRRIKTFLTSSTHRDDSVALVVCLEYLYVNGHRGGMRTRRKLEREREERWTCRQECDAVLGDYKNDAEL